MKNKSLIDPREIYIILITHFERQLIKPIVIPQNNCSKTLQRFIKFSLIHAAFEF